ncbi:hypothetical protein BGX34_004985, partial [Mortierella sp. NVP85]
MTSPIIGNGPGYKNGEAIVLPILPTFNRRQSVNELAAKNHTSCSALSSPTTIKGSSDFNTSTVAGANGATATPAAAAQACACNPDDLRGGPDAGIVVFSG